MWCVTSMPAPVSSASNSGWSVHREWLVYFRLSSTPTSMGLQARDQFRVEESWCLAWGSLGHRFCHCPQLPLCIPSLPSAPPRCGRPQLRGIPCYPASLMKSDTRPEDLIYTPTGPLPPLVCPPLTVAGSHRAAAMRMALYPRGFAPQITGGAQRAEPIVWNREDLIVFIHELCDWY